MEVQMFNGWYFFWVIISIATFFILFFILRKANQKIQKLVLFSLLVIALALHF